MSFALKFTRMFFDRKRRETQLMIMMVFKSLKFFFTLSFG